MLKEFGMVFFIIIVHELGHLFTAIYFKWNWNKIVIYPFGGCLKFDEKINRSLKEELFILLNGPITQIIFYFIIFYLSMKGFMTYRNFLLFKGYHYSLLLFNLLPIYPLDGGRLLNILMNYILPFKKGNKIVIFISFLVIITVMFFYKSFNFTLMGILIVFELWLYLRRQDFLYNRMLLERYIGNFRFKRLKKIYDKNNMYKDCRHLILYKNKFITERSYLNERFKVIR